MNFRNLNLFLITLKNIFVINILIAVYKIKKKKIIIFYHPKKDLEKISTYYINSLLNFHKKKNFNVIILNNSSNQFFLNNYIIQYFLKFIWGVDIFLSNYVCDFFPYRCKKIYMHHDIYDTPVSGHKREKALFERFQKYDFMLIPSVKSKFVFNKLKLNYNKSKIELKIIGYYKLDYLKKKFYKKKKQKNLKNIIIAPTNYYSFPNMSLIESVEKIIKKILKKTNLNIIFRPHPSNFNDPKTFYIKDKFSKNKRFIFDKSNNYFETYASSKCLITDLSGTAYTYSFLTNRPTIFFSNYESILKKLKYDKLNYFKDRNKIGYVIKDLNNLIKSLNNKTGHKNKSENIIKMGLSIFKIGSSKYLFKKFIDEII